MDSGYDGGTYIDRGIANERRNLTMEIVAERSCDLPYDLIANLPQAQRRLLR